MMAANLQKSANFFFLTEPAQADIDKLKSAAFASPNWVWTDPDAWKSPISGKYIMTVAGNGMTLKRIGSRKFSLTISGTGGTAYRQYVRTHRFVYKLDAFNGADYLYTIIAGPFQSQFEQYGDAASDLTYFGHFPVPITAGEATNIKWNRRGAGEWRD
jgi:hypothetical protein